MWDGIGRVRMDAALAGAADAVSAKSQRLRAAERVYNARPPKPPELSDSDLLRRARRGVSPWYDSALAAVEDEIRRMAEARERHAKATWWLPRLLARIAMLSAEGQLGENERNLARALGDCNPEQVAAQLPLVRLEQDLLKEAHARPGIELRTARREHRRAVVRLGRLWACERAGAETLPALAAEKSRRGDDVLRAESRRLAGARRRPSGDEAALRHRLDIADRQAEAARTACPELQAGVRRDAGRLRAALDPTIPPVPPVTRLARRPAAHR